MQSAPWEIGIVLAIETFDHFARDQAEFFQIIHYIEQNPVVGRLVSRAEDYRSSSACLRLKLGLKVGDAISNGGLGS